MKMENNLKKIEEPYKTYIEMYKKFDNFLQETTIKNMCGSLRCKEDKCIFLIPSSCELDIIRDSIEGRKKILEDKLTAKYPGKPIEFIVYGDHSYIPK